MRDHDPQALYFLAMIVINTIREMERKNTLTFLSNACHEGLRRTIIMVTREDDDIIEETSGPEEEKSLSPGLLWWFPPEEQTFVWEEGFDEDCFFIMTCLSLSFSWWWRTLFRTRKSFDSWIKWLLSGFLLNDSCRPTSRWPLTSCVVSVEERVVSAAVEGVEDVVLTDSLMTSLSTQEVTEEGEEADDDDVNVTSLLKRECVWEAVWLWRLASLDEETAGCIVEVFRSIWVEGADGEILAVGIPCLLVF